MSTKILKKIKRRSALLSKHIYQHFAYSGHTFKTVVAIFGCQRSGTTLLLELLERDKRVRAFEEEYSAVSRIDQQKIRLDPLPMVQQVIDHCHAPIIVMKPLVETQNAPEILRFFTGSKGLWMHRHYRDVCASNLRLFGQNNGISDFKQILSGDQKNWRSQGVPEHILETITPFNKEDISEHDAAALFWYVRNSLFYERELDRHPQMLMIRYNDLVSSPECQLQRLYRFLEVDFSEEIDFSDVHPRSIGKGRSVSLSPAIENLCKSMYTRLEETFEHIYRKKAAA